MARAGAKDSRAVHRARTEHAARASTRRGRRRAISLLVLLALGVTATSKASAPEGSIEAFVDRELPASGAPGLAYAVVIDGDVATVAARGLLSAGGDQEVTPDTPFLTGSISKSFTALAVMQLVEAGDVELDAELERYLEVFKGRPAGAITIRHLLSHTSGYSTLQGNAPYEDETGAPDEIERRVARVAEALRPPYSPGARWEYSNLNYLILGRLIEVVSGQDYETYIERNILEPVGMRNSFVADGATHDAMATGHRPWFGVKTPLEMSQLARSTGPQGGVVASANDLARYMRVMVNGRDDLLSADGKAMMMRPASEASPFYGFGWFIGDGSAWHSGSSPGVETLMTLVPSKRNGVVVLTNAGSGTGFAETSQLRKGITASALGRDYDGEGSRWSQKALFVALTCAPVVFLLCIAWAWRDREAIRAKAGAFGLFSLWFPLLTTLGGAWIILGLVPRLFGVPIATLRRFQPDFGLVLIATAVTGVLWAVLRLVVAYTGKRRASGERA